MDYILSSLPSIISAVTVAALGAIFALLKNLLKGQKANNAATRYLLKDRILNICVECQEKGCINPRQSEVLSELSREYHNLGGNSFIKTQVKATLSLPLVKEEQC